MPLPLELALALQLGRLIPLRGAYQCVLCGAWNRLVIQCVNSTKINSKGMHSDIQACQYDAKDDAQRCYFFNRDVQIADGTADIFCWIAFDASNF